MIVLVDEYMNVEILGSTLQEVETQDIFLTIRTGEKDHNFILSNVRLNHYIFPVPCSCIKELDIFKLTGFLIIQLFRWLQDASITTFDDQALCQHDHTPGGVSILHIAVRSNVIPPCSFRSPSAKRSLQYRTAIWRNVTI